MDELTAQSAAALAAGIADGALEESGGGEEGGGGGGGAGATPARRRVAASIHLDELRTLDCLRGRTVLAFRLPPGSSVEMPGVWELPGWWGG